jgi:hypothetical protein
MLASIDTKIKVKFDVSVSQLNPRLPRGQTHLEMMQGTAAFSHEIVAPLLPQAAPVFAHITALDTAVDMLDPPPLVQCLLRSVLLPRELLAA